MTHRIIPTTEAHWSVGDRWAVSNVQAYPPRKPTWPWKAIGFLACAIVMGVGLILIALIPAIVQAIHHG